MRATNESLWLQEHGLEAVESEGLTQIIDYACTEYHSNLRNAVIGNFKSLLHTAMLGHYINRDRGAGQVNPSYVRGIWKQRKRAIQHTIKYLTNDNSRVAPDDELLRFISQLNGDPTNFERGDVTVDLENWTKFVVFGLKLQSSIANMKNTKRKDEIVLKNYTLIPQTSLKRCHIKVDTTALFELFNSSTSTDKVSRGNRSNKAYIWNRFIRVPKGCQGTSFHHMFFTDGVDCNVLYRKIVDGNDDDNDENDDVDMDDGYLYEFSSDSDSDSDCDADYEPDSNFYMDCDDSDEEQEPIEIDQQVVDQFNGGLVNRLWAADLGVIHTAVLCSRNQGENGSFDSNEVITYLPKQLTMKMTEVDKYTSLMKKIKKPYTDREKSLRRQSAKKNGLCPSKKNPHSYVQYVKLRLDVLEIGMKTLVEPIKLSHLRFHQYSLKQKFLADFCNFLTNHGTETVILGIGLPPVKFKHAIKKHRLSPLRAIFNAAQAFPNLHVVVLPEDRTTKNCSHCHGEQIFTPLKRHVLCQACPNDNNDLLPLTETWQKEIMFAPKPKKVQNVPTQRSGQPRHHHRDGNAARNILCVLLAALRGERLNAFKKRRQQ